MFARFKKSVLASSFKCAVAAGVLVGTASPASADSCDENTPTCDTCHPTTISPVSYCTYYTPRTYMKCTAEDPLPGTQNPGKCEDVYDNANLLRGCARYRRVVMEGETDCRGARCTNGEFVDLVGPIVPNQCKWRPS